MAGIAAGAACVSATTGVATAMPWKHSMGGEVTVEGANAIHIRNGQIQVVEGPHCGKLFHARRWGKGTVERSTYESGVHIFHRVGMNTYLFWADEWLCAENEGNIGFNRKNPKQWEQFYVVGDIKKDFKLRCLRDKKMVYVRDSDRRLKHDKGDHPGTVLRIIDC